MADAFADLGRFLATPQYWVSMIAAIIFIVGGIAIIVKGPQEPPGKPQPPKSQSILQGSGLIGGGLLLMFLARRWRNLVRTNDRYARLSGILDVFNMFK